MKFGGLKKSASRAALIAAATVITTGAYAADLGGDCCADLEERVAELEATTARKGNRKVSLTISGQVNKLIMHYNDGTSSNTYWGIDNTNSSSRFNFTGSAKVSPTFSAGFNMTIEVASGARSVAVNQTRAEVRGCYHDRSSVQARSVVTTTHSPCATQSSGSKALRSAVCPWAV